MIGFRYHVVSLVAVFLALAGGIALGAGPLQEPVNAELSTATGGGDEAALRGELDTARRLDDFQAAYDSGTAGLVLDSRLEGAAVSLLVLPGADPAIVADVTDALALADARVVSTVTLTDALVDPAERQLAENLVQGMLRRVDDVDAVDGDSGYELVGAALGRAFLTRSTTQVVPDNSADSIRAAFETARLLTVDGGVDRRAQLALVVAGDPVDNAPDGQADVEADLLTGIDGSDRGTVLVGTTASAAADGAVAAVRASDEAATDEATGVSTVAGAETATGRLVGVLALAEQSGGGSGHYGPDAVDGALPDLGG